ncbi:MAG: LysR substrate-binding domain-containing protein [Propionibacteriaceae bacterium]
MNIRDLEYLVALSEHRHFSRAAAACYVSQPTLSTQIKKLERELGAPLIERGSGPVILTSAGEEVVTRAKHLLANAAEIRTIASQAVNPRSGIFTLGIFPTLGPYLLPHIVPAIRSQLPELRLRLVEDKTTELLTSLRQGKLDAAIVATPADTEGFSEIPLFREEFVLAIPADYPQITAPATAEAMANSDILLLDEGHCLREQALTFCQQIGASESEFRATSLETLRHMVAAGAGITLLPRLAISSPVALNDGISLVEFAEPKPAREVALLWRQSSPLGDLMAELAPLLQQVPGGLITPL